MYIFLNNDFACICMHIFVFLLLSFIIFNQWWNEVPDSQKHARFDICIRADEVDLNKN